MKILFTAALFSVCIFQSPAQDKSAPILERKISLEANNEKVSSVLTRMGQLAGFSFSYNSALISMAPPMTMNAKSRSVREILNDIFKGTLNYKVKGNHLILSKATLPKSSPRTTVFIISGYVEDNESGVGVPEASVYEKNTLTSSVTNAFGYYKIKLEKPLEPVSLSVSKKNYKDTLVVISVPGNQYVNISIRPVGLDSIAVTTTTQEDSTSSNEEDLTFPHESDANMLNIRDTMYRDVQVSVLPFIGTNGRLSGNVINDYSINVFGGYSLGTRQIELGFFLNADRGDASWLQIAGLGNAVGGNFYGLQMAGLFNLNRGETKAVQIAFFANTNLGDMQGVQVAGFTNTNLGSADGVLIAGFSNFVSKQSSGHHLEGFGMRKSRGLEIAGIANVQIGTYQGSQISGITNIASHSITGSQIGSIFNYGHHVHGTQIGLFNYADSLGGVPIGLMSFVNHGYHKIEVSADEIFYTNLAFRTGVRKFYNIVTAGMKPEKAFSDEENVWAFGYGLGTAPRLTRWLDLNIDLTSNHVNKGGFTPDLSLLNKLYIGFDLKLVNKMSFTVGATLNGYLTKTTFTDYPIIFTDHSPHIFRDQTFDNNVNLKMWWGLKAGLRFL